MIRKEEAPVRRGLLAELHLRAYGNLDVEDEVVDSLASYMEMAAEAACTNLEERFPGVEFNIE